MRIKKGFEMRDVCGEKVVIAQGIENLDFSKMISLNESAAYLWEHLVGTDFDEAKMISLLKEEYEVSDADAAKDAASLASVWKKQGLLE